MTSSPTRALRLGYALAFCGLATAQIDHRTAQSPVKDQGHRGTCVAFAVCGALETFPGVPTDLSEQLLYATVKRHQNAVDKWLRKTGRTPLMGEGDQLDVYVPLFELVGTSHESFLPYDPDPKKAGPDVPDDLRRYLELAQIGEQDLLRLRDGFGKYGFRSDDCHLLADDAARDVARIKRELNGGRLAIPVSYALYGPKWSSADDDPKRERTIIHPGLTYAYRFAGEGNDQWKGYGVTKLLAAGRKIDFVEGVQSGKIEIGKYPDPGGTGYGGHAVTIVGYDERGFLVKNSWGTTWGDDGYCTVLFDYHALFATRALLIDDVYIRTPELSPFATTAAIRGAELHLKVQRRGTDDAPRVVLSYWAREPRDPDIEVVEYRIETHAGDGTWRELATHVVRTGDVEHRHGGALALDGDTAKALLAADAARVIARFGGPQIRDPDAPDHATFLRTVRFAEFTPATLTHAHDLTEMPQSEPAAPSPDRPTRPHRGRRAQFVDTPFAPTTPARSIAVCRAAAQIPSADRDRAERGPGTARHRPS